MINDFQFTFRQLCSWMVKNGAVIFAFSIPLHMLCSSYTLIIWSLFSIFYLLVGGYSSNEFINVFKKTKSIGFFIVLYVFLLFGLFSSENLIAGIEKVSITIPFVILPVLFWVNKKLLNVKLVLNAFFLGLVVSLVISAVCAIAVDNFLIPNFHLGLDSGTSYAQGGFNIFHHPSYFSMLVTIAMALLLFQFESISIAQWVRIAILVLCASLIFLISSKAGVLISIVLFLIKSVHVLLSKSRPFSKLLILFTIVVPSIFLFQNKRVQNMVTDFNDILQQETPIHPTESTVMRWSIWEKAVLLILEKPIFGYGTGDANDELMNAYKQEPELLNEIIVRKYNAHNTFFQLWLMIGFTGPAFICIILLSVMNALKFNFFSTAMALIFFLNFLFESMLDRHAGVMIFTFFVCLTIVGKDSAFFQRKLAH